MQEGIEKKSQVKGVCVRYETCNPDGRAIRVHFLRSLSVFQALMALKLKKSLMPCSDSRNFGRVIYVLWYLAPERRP
jgi:hypothetical protein